MTLPPTAGIKRGEALYAKYAKQLAVLGEDPLLNPAEVAALFAAHDAELAATRVVLALSASKTEKGFPVSLDAIAGRFGGQLLTSPYNGAALSYELRNGGKEFLLSVPKVTLKSRTLPAVNFDSSQPAEITK